MDFMYLDVWCLKKAIWIDNSPLKAIRQEMLKMPNFDKS